MAAYVINDMEVTDPEQLEGYKKLSPPTVLKYGGKFLARGGVVESVEGEWAPKRVVILEFPSVEQARAWVNSPEYAPARRMRQKASRSNIIIVDGVPPA